MLEVTHRELEKHNKPDDLWLAIRGNVYDVTKWVDNHPGGKDVLFLNAGRDATQLFEAYHPVHVWPTLKKYQIGRLVSSELPTFPPVSKFYLTLKKRVEGYFKEHNLKPNHAPSLWIISTLLVGLVLGSHFAAVYLAETAWWVSVFLAIIMGVGMALLSLIPVHEASHVSIAKQPIFSRLFGAIHDVVNGCSFYNWLHQHFLGHHPYTNVSDVDPDVHTNNPDFRRIKPSQPLFSYYRLQQFYAPIAYGLLGIKFRITDIQMMLSSTRMNGNIRVNDPVFWHAFIFWFGKAFFIFYKLILPVLIFDVSFMSTLYIALIADFVVSWYLAFVFQVNHIVAPAVWPTVDKESGVVDMDWAELQVKSTVDYAHGNKLVTFLSGALNYQVVHHLFPYVSQIYYPRIAGIVLDTCREFGIPYVVMPTFGEAFKAHLKYLQLMGKQTRA